MLVDSSPLFKNSAPIHFANYISLGSACYISLNLIRRGLRHQSFPFDWIICNYRFVEDSLHNGKVPRIAFKSRHLYQDPICLFKYYNPDYDVWFVHDYEDTLPVNIQTYLTRKKYQRRLRRLLNAIRKPTLLIRQCETQEEIDYLAANYATFLEWLRKRNPENQAIFIINQEHRAPFLHKDLSASPFVTIEFTADDQHRFSQAPLEGNELLKRYFDEVSSSAMAKPSNRKHISKDIVGRFILGIVRRIYRRTYHHSLTYLG